MKKFLSKRNVILLIVLLAGLFLSTYVASRPRLAPGQKLVADIQNIETLQTRFNRDAGETRLIILVSPT